MYIRYHMYIYHVMLQSLLKLKKQLNRKDKITGTKWYRWDVTINPELIKELGWKNDQKLIAKRIGKKLVIEKE